MLATIVLAAIVGIAGIGYYKKHAERAEFYRKIDSLMQQGSKLSAMTAQGVTFSEFRSQLASVHAEYDLLKARWDEQKWPAGYGTFARAVFEWDQVLTFWQADLKRPAIAQHISSNPDLVSFYMTMDPKLRALASDDGKPAVNLNLATRAFMSDASEHFEESKNAVERSR